MGWRDWRLAVLAALKMRLNLNCPLAFVPGYLVLNWMETEDPSTDTTGMDGSEGEPGGEAAEVGDRWRMKTNGRPLEIKQQLGLNSKAHRQRHVRGHKAGQKY